MKKAESKQSELASSSEPETSRWLESSSRFPQTLGLRCRVFYPAQQKPLYRVFMGTALTSQWCRTRETAQLAFPSLVQDAPAFNSFFSERSSEAEQTRAALQILSGWRGPGVLVVVTHQVNITALTGIVPDSGEGVIVRVSDGKVEVVGRIKP